MIFNTIWPFSVIFQVSQFLLRPFLNHVFICNNFYYCNIAKRGHLWPSQFCWDIFWIFFFKPFIILHCLGMMFWMFCGLTMILCYSNWAQLYVYIFWLAGQTENYINNKSSCMSTIATYFNFVWFGIISWVLAVFGYFIAFSRL